MSALRGAKTRNNFPVFIKYVLQHLRRRQKVPYMGAHLPYLELPFVEFPLEHAFFGSSPAQQLGKLFGRSASFFGLLHLRKEPVLHHPYGSELFQRELRISLAGL